EDVCSWEVGLLRLRRFISVWSERADVNQPDNTIVGSGTGDDASAVGVADEYSGAADPAQRCSHQGDVLCRCVEAVLRRNTLIPLCLKRNDQLAKARAIGPESVAKHDAWFALRGFRIHFCSPVPLCLPLILKIREPLTPIVIIDIPKSFRFAQRHLRVAEPSLGGRNRNANLSRHFFHRMAL